MTFSFAAKVTWGLSAVAVSLVLSGCSGTTSSAPPVDALQLTAATSAGGGGGRSGDLRVVSELPPPSQTCWQPSPVGKVQASAPDVP